MKGGKREKQRYALGVLFVPWPCHSLVASNLTSKATSFDKFNAVKQQFENVKKVVYCITAARRLNFSTEASGQLPVASGQGSFSQAQTNFGLPAHPLSLINVKQIAKPSGYM